ncbi:hypothetical protein ACFCXH_00945 [Streptomyces nojiriensis]|uniref:hypothetical protein n=1 Tax=Streptomyces nojiriensis TaxID=66374 RepID=UPI0035DF0E44
MTAPTKSGHDRVYDNFYRVERAGAVRLRDGGGPFGFDISKAVMVDDLISAYRCDGLVETGSFLGDTSVYLARTYGDIPLWTCDIDPVFSQVAGHRLSSYPHARCEATDSPTLVEEANARFTRPLYYLDAHWEQEWPLSRELAAITHGIVIIDDFDIGHHRFSFDTYQGRACGPEMLRPLVDTLPVYYTLSPEAATPFPVLQVGRRSGIGVVAYGPDATRACDTNTHLVRHVNPAVRETEGAGL